MVPSTHTASSDSVKREEECYRYLILRTYPQSLPSSEDYDVGRVPGVAAPHLEGQLGN